MTFLDDIEYELEPDGDGATECPSRSDVLKLLKLARMAERAKYLLADVTYDDDQFMLDWLRDYAEGDQVTFEEWKGRGFESYVHFGDRYVREEHVETAWHAATAAERERCAKVAESYACKECAADPTSQGHDACDVCSDIAAAIRG
jgi:hypothetical protein